MTRATRNDSFVLLQRDRCFLKSTVRQNASAGGKDVLEEARFPVDAYEVSWGEERV